MAMLNNQMVTGNMIIQVFHQKKLIDNCLVAPRRVAEICSERSHQGDTQLRRCLPGRGEKKRRQISAIVQ